MSELAEDARALGQAITELQKRVSVLAAKRREVLIALKEDGYSEREIGRLLGISQVRVNKIVRGMK